MADEYVSKDGLSHLVDEVLGADKTGLSNLKTYSDDTNYDHTIIGTEKSIYDNNLTGTAKWSYKTQEYEKTYPFLFAAISDTWGNKDFGMLYQDLESFVTNGRDESKFLPFGDPNGFLTADNDKPFVFGYDSTTKKYGFWTLDVYRQRYLMTPFSDPDGNLTAENDVPFQFGYDSDTGKYGYYTDGARGADSFVPFSSGGNSNLQYNEETGYIQAKNSDGEWVDIYKAATLPLTELNLLSKGICGGFSITQNPSYGSLTYVDGESLVINASNSYAKTIGVIATNSYTIDLSKVSLVTVTFSSVTGNGSLYVKIGDVSQTITNTSTESSYTFDVSSVDSGQITLTVSMYASSKKATITGIKAV